MKLFYTEQSLASLQECLDFFPPEVPADKVNEIRDRILAKADKLWLIPISVSKKNTLNILAKIIAGSSKGIIRLSIECKEKIFTLQISLTAARILPR
jgi:hypothetical protein